MADRIVVMHDGRIEQIGTPLELYDRPANLFVAQFIGSPAMNVLEGVYRNNFIEALGARWPVSGVPRRRRPAGEVRHPAGAHRPRRRRHRRGSGGGRAHGRGDRAPRQGRGSNAHPPDPWPLEHRARASARSSRRASSTCISSTPPPARASSRIVLRARFHSSSFMAQKSDWQFPVEMRPRPEDWRFDLDGALDAVVQLRAEIPEDAFTAQILGTERVGNGVVIRDDGLVLTIGYLITEASTIWLTTNKGVVVPAFPLGYDQTTGFGLVQPLAKLGVRPLARGSAGSCRIGENVVIAGHGGRARALQRHGVREARVRRLLGVRARRGDLHGPGASAVGRRRAHRLRRQARSPSARSWSRRRSTAACCRETCWCRSTTSSPSSTTC